MLAEEKHNNTPLVYNVEFSPKRNQPMTRAATNAWGILGSKQKVRMKWTLDGGVYELE